MKQKAQRWQDITSWVSSTTDSIGCPIDEGIRDTVIALNVLDISTLASCEGHLDHGCVAPWIDIGAPDARPLPKQAHLKQMKVEQPRLSGVSLEERRRLSVEAEINYHFV